MRQSATTIATTIDGNHGYRRFPRYNARAIESPVVCRRHGISVALERGAGKEQRRGQPFGPDRADFRRICVGTRERETILLIGRVHSSGDKREAGIPSRPRINRANRGHRREDSPRCLIGPWQCPRTLLDLSGCRHDDLILVP